jgi:hypothetical protein
MAPVIGDHRWDAHLHLFPVGREVAGVRRQGA